MQLMTLLPDGVQDYHIWVPAPYTGMCVCVCVHVCVCVYLYVFVCMYVYRTIIYGHLLPTQVCVYSTYCCLPLPTYYLHTYIHTYIH
jgi:hypothetical protein